MWRILEADLRYHKGILMMFLPLILAYSNGFLPALAAPFLMVNSIIPFRSREKRDRLQAVLPVTLRQIGMARILLVILPCLAWYLVFLLFWWSYGAAGWEEVRWVMIFFGAIVAGYSVAFLLNDLFLFTRAATKLIVVGLLLFSLSLWLALDLKSSASPDFVVIRVIDTAQAYNPFRGVFGNFLFLAASLALAALSVFTFVRRKSHLCID